MNPTFKDCTILRMISTLKDAKDDAVEAQMDHHFIAEIDHLIATAEANRKEDNNG